MAKISYKASYYLFYVLIALTIVVLGLFFGVGYNNPMGDYNAPEHTETLIIFMYAMTGICVLVTIIGALLKFVSGLKDDPKGAVKSIISVILLVGVVVVCYAISSDAPLTMADGSQYTDVMWLKLTDCMIYVMYFLLAVTGVATLINLSGIFKR